MSPGLLSARGRCAPVLGAVRLPGANSHFGSLGYFSFFALPNFLAVSFPSEYNLVDGPRGSVSLATARAQCVFGMGSLKIRNRPTSASYRMAANSHGQRWIRITTFKINDMRTISCLSLDSKQSCISYLFTMCFTSPTHGYSDNQLPLSRAQVPTSVLLALAEQALYKVVSYEAFYPGRLSSMRARAFLSAILVVLASNTLAFSADATEFSAFAVQPPILVNGSVCLLSFHVAGNPRTVSAKWMDHQLTFSLGPRGTWSRASWRSL